MPTLFRPAKGRVTQAFGPSHRAIDFGWGAGRTVRAAADGVASIDSTPGYGLRVSINHGGLITRTTVTRYAHLAAVDPSVLRDPNVRQGQAIATMGNSGTFAKFVHLHFELLLNVGPGLARLNPSSYFTSTAGGTVTPIHSRKESDMYIIEAPKDVAPFGRRFALIGPNGYQLLTDLAAAAEIRGLGAPIPVTAADFPGYIARAQARQVAVSVTPEQVAAISAGVKVDLSGVTKAIVALPAAVGQYVINLLKQQWSK